MKAETRTLQQVLLGDVRFVVPVYQRPYVWNQERQWEPLWDDVEATARRLLVVRSIAKQKGVGSSEADKAAAPHFIGAVVIEQQPVATGDINVRSVVDGQQRLTTVQLLLRGVLDALEGAGVEGPNLAKIRKMIRNDEDVVLSVDGLLKVWPRPAEQPAFRSAMETADVDPYSSNFAAARHYFASAAAGFLEDASIEPDPYGEGTDEMRRASLLVATLVGLVKLVVIDLEDVDDAQVIFEALNARNTPLSATDLVKNLLFMRAAAQGHKPDELYEAVWSRFDKDAQWWREAVGVGHAQRARQDWLLGDWLIAELGRTINVGRLYGEFRQWLDSTGTTPVEALQGVRRYADAYEKLNGRMPGATPLEIKAFRRIEELNITVATPVLLWLLVQPAHRVPPHEREKAFAAVESFVVRRMAAKWQTRGYGAVFAEVLNRAQQAAEHSGTAVVAALRADVGGYQWPTDGDLAEAFVTSRYYGPGGINQERLRLLLGAIDRHLQEDTHKGEPVTIKYDKLQVEHVIPQSWREHWPLQLGPEDDGEAMEQRRDAIVHRIGNLTLASSRLNPAMGNDPWASKRRELEKHSKLKLNEHLCLSDQWNEDLVEIRGRWLAEQLGREWPGPDEEQWQLDS